MLLAMRNPLIRGCRSASTMLALAVGLTLAAGLALAACAGGSPVASSRSARQVSSSSGSPEPVRGAAATAAIKANWTAFFDASTPVSQRLSLLQDGSEFAAVIGGQSARSLAGAASSKVTAVKLTSRKQADVTYTILLGDNPVLTGQQGLAVYQDGVWKVAPGSFCDLLRLENSGSEGASGNASLPAACQG